MCASNSARIAVAFKTLGCKVNRVESEDIAADLLGRGVALAEEEHAAVIVINTCTVTAEADAKARKTIRRAIAAPSRPIVVVTGCLASIDASALEALDERVIVEADKERVADRVAEALGVASASPHEHAVRSGVGFRTRSMLKVEDGCDAFCSYCIVPFARGVPRSVPAARAIEEAASLVAAGAREIVLTGINLGKYRDADTDLAELVRQVAATGVARLRLSSIEPMDLTDELLGVLSETPAVCRHLHVPLQSGSDEVLQTMRRGYTVREYEERVATTRAALPGVAITTDVMAGFPGETDEQGQQTLDVCERIDFAKLHVFRYSARVGTDAAAMAQVPAGVRSKRAAALRSLGDRLRREYAHSRLGASDEILIERIAKDGTAFGTTRDYLQVSLQDARGLAEGQLVTARLYSWAGGLVSAVPLATGEAQRDE